jgi:hypothetical protein
MSDALPAAMLRDAELEQVGSESRVTRTGSTPRASTSINRIAKHVRDDTDVRRVLSTIKAFRADEVEPDNDKHGCGLPDISLYHHHYCGSIGW